MLRTLVPAGAILALLTGTAAAQLPPISISPFNEPPKRALTQEEIDKQKAAEDAYRHAVGKIPEKKKSNDPWGNIRPDTAAKNKQ